MPYRQFTDKTGTEWQVWDIVPQLTERRLSEGDRRLAPATSVEEERRRAQRRIAHTRRAVLSGSFAQGWLCFDNGSDKRRLTPVPDDWTTCPDDRLHEYLQHADRVVPGRLSQPMDAITESAGETTRF